MFHNMAVLTLPLGLNPNTGVMNFIFKAEGFMDTIPCISFLLTSVGVEKTIKMYVFSFGPVHEAFGI